MKSLSEIAGGATEKLRKIPTERRSTIAEKETVRDVSQILYRWQMNSVFAKV